VLRGLRLLYIPTVFIRPWTMNIRYLPFISRSTSFPSLLLFCFCRSPKRNWKMPVHSFSRNQSSLFLVCIALIHSIVYTFAHLIVVSSSIHSLHFDTFPLCSYLSGCYIRLPRILVTPFIDILVFFSYLFGTMQWEAICFSVTFHVVWALSFHFWMACSHADQTNTAYDNLNMDLFP